MNNYLDLPTGGFLFIGADGSLYLAQFLTSVDLWVGAGFRAVWSVEAIGELADYTIDQAVEVYSFGHWYAGTVVKVGRTRVQVRYTTGTGTTRVKAFSDAKVRPTV